MIQTFNNQNMIKFNQIGKLAPPAWWSHAFLHASLPGSLDSIPHFHSSKFKLQLHPKTWNNHHTRICLCILGLVWIALDAILIICVLTCYIHEKSCILWIMVCIHMDENEYKIFFVKIWIFYVFFSLLFFCRVFF